MCIVSRWWWKNRPSLRLQSLALSRRKCPCSISSTLSSLSDIFNTDFVILLLFSLTKKWSWHGELYIEASPDRADRLCTIQLSEPTDARPMGLRLDVLYTPEVSVLRLKKFHEMSDLYLMLRACAPVQQCCKVAHATEADFAGVATLSGWMTRNSQVRFVLSCFVFLF